MVINGGEVINCCHVGRVRLKLLLLLAMAVVSSPRIEAIPTDVIVVRY